jgi:hypothetical protein
MKINIRIVLLILISLFATFVFFFRGTHITAQADPALCNDWNFVEDAEIRAEFGNYRYLANCKLINPRLTGIVIPDAEVTQVVNVFYPERNIPFETGGVICLQGDNELLFTTGPGAPVSQLDVYRVAEWGSRYTCATIYETGYVLRTRQSSGLSPTRPAPIAQNQCHVTTTDHLRLRNEPNRESQVLQVLKPNISLASDVRIISRNSSEWWFHVSVTPEGGQSGWLSGDYLTFTGDCGYVCRQDPSGTRLICGIQD